MLEKGMWVAKFPEKEDGVTFGYHINSLYSPYGMYSWAKMAKDHDDGRWVFNGSLKGVSANAEMIPDVPTVVMSQNEIHPKARLKTVGMI